jgi:hypothetical protein
LSNLKVFEINLHYLIVAETEEQAIGFLQQLTGEKIDKVRECHLEKEGFVVFNEKIYRMTSYQTMLEDMLSQQKILHYPFVLRTKPLDR